MRLLIIIKMALFLGLSLSAQSIEGDWHGEFNAGKVTVGFVFTLENNEGELTGIMAIPARNINNLKARATTFENGQLLIDGSNFGWQYKASYNEAEDVFKGTFKEGLNTLPLNLERGRGEVIERTKRPQEPTGELPYSAEEVVFQNETAGIKLAGTLTLPEGAEKAPVAILITGSGPQNRDEEIFDHKPFLVLADHLTRQGIAVLRYDDRGVNDSEGDFAASTTADFATDLQAAVDYLKTRSDIDATKIGLVGHSEGGIIAPIVAAESPDDIAFVVSLAGTAESGYNTSLRQAFTMAMSQVEDPEAYETFIRGVLDIASADKDIHTVRSELSKHYQDSDFFHKSIPAGADKDLVLKSLIELRTSTWVRYFYHYNPADMFKKVKAPILHINGSKDVQVLAKPNQKALREALESVGHTDFTIEELPGLNHFFQEAETGVMSEYQQIEQTFSPKALKLVSDWILERVK